MEDVPAKEIYKFNGQEYKISVRDTQEINLEWGGKLIFINSIVGGSIDARFMPAILKGIMDRMEQGPLTGSYARDVRVIVYDGKMHPVDSNEISFRLAGRNAFAQASGYELRTRFRTPQSQSASQRGGIVLDGSQFAVGR